MLQKAKAAYSFWFQVCNNIPKTHRHSLGSKVDNYFLELLKCIFSALYLSGEQKVKRIETAIGKLDGVKFFSQIAWENKCVSNKDYATLSEKLDEVGKIIGGWKKGLEKKTPAQPKLL